MRRQGVELRKLVADLSVNEEALRSVILERLELAALKARLSECKP
jgi:hypothetical protein